MTSTPTPRPADSRSVTPLARLRRLPPITLALLAVWVVAGTLGARTVVTGLARQPRVALLTEDARRLTSWPPIYSFAHRCVAPLAPGATLLLLDQTGYLQGPDVYGVAPDVDQSDLNTFMYVAYPRAVTPLGHMPAGGVSGLPRADYLALWRRTDYRSPATRAEARSTEATLRAALPGRDLCAFDDGKTSSGVLFALSPAGQGATAQRVAAAAGGGRAPPLPSVLGSGATYALTLLGLAVLAAIGALTLRLIAGGALPPLLSAALALPLGGLAVGLQLMLYALLAVPWSAPWLALPPLLLAGVVLWRDRAAARRALTGRAPRRAARRSALAADERLAAGLLAALAAAVTVAAPIALPFDDGLSRYYFKAHAFFVDRGAIPYYAQAAGRAPRPSADLLFSLPAHPPLISLDVTWLYLFSGGENEHASLLLWPLFFLSLLAAFYALARGAVSRRTALWSTLALACIGSDLTYSAIVGSYTDMPLSAYLLMGCGLLWYWSATPAPRSPRPLLLAGLLLAACALTKEEGAPAALVALAATPLLALDRRTGDTPGPQRQEGAWWRPAAWSVPTLALGVLPWTLLRLRYPPPNPNIYTNQGRAALLHNLAVATAGVGLRAVAHWYPLLALLCAWAILRGWRARMGTEASGYRCALFLAAVIVGQLAVDIVGIAVSPIDTRAEVSWAAPRLLEQLVPLLFLLITALWPDILTRGQPGEAAPPEGTPTRATPRGAALP